MKWFICILLLATTATAQAGEPIITETENSITVEYTGTPAAEKDSAKAAADTAAKPVTSRLDFLKQQIAKLKTEMEALRTLKGNESETELAKINESIKDKQHKIDIYTAEIQQINDREQQRTNNQATTTDEQQLNLQNRRQEMKREVNELKQQRFRPPAVSQ